MAMEMRRTVIVRDLAGESFVRVFHVKGAVGGRTFLCHFVCLSKNWYVSV